MLTGEARRTEAFIGSIIVINTSSTILAAIIGVTSVEFVLTSNASKLGRT